MSYRIRSLVNLLRYSDLNKAKRLPKKPLFTQIPKRGGSFPSLAKKIGYDQFGVYIDYFIRLCLAKQFDLDHPLKTKNYQQLYEICCSPVIEKKQLSSIKDYLAGVGETVLSFFEEAKKIDIEPEWVFENVSGHPDLVVDDTVYDIKTSGQFGKMRQYAIMQVLSYYCLAQLNKLPITHVGLILPAQGMCVKVCLKDWEWRGFWTDLCKTIALHNRLRPKVSDLILYQSMIQPYAGSHVNKEKTIWQTLTQVPPDIPVQLFFGGRAQAKFTVTDMDIGKTLKMVEDSKYRFYIHAPYTLNLSRKYDDNWVVQTVKKHLSTAVSLGSKGVVIHCGVKANDNPDAYENMFNAVVACSEEATKETPLLIETSAGETGELLSSPAELISFYLSLPAGVQEKVKICVDTCHVFVAGHEPTDFVQELIEHKIPIGLFHYNDARGDKGCCHDSHAPVGHGFVGFERLIKIGAYAIQNNIDLVQE